MGTAQETKMIKNIFLFGVLPLALFGFGMTKALGLVFTQETAIQAQVMKLRKFHKDGFSEPSRALIDAQRKTIAEAQEQVVAIYSYSCAPQVAIPDEVSERGVYFKEKLYLSQRDLLAQAKKAGMIVPENLGFEDRLPGENEVPVLLMQLALVEEFMSVAFDAGVSEILVLEMLESERMKNVNEEPMGCHTVSVHVELSCYSEVLVKVLYGVGNMNPFVVMDSIVVTRGKDGLVNCAFVMTRLAKEEGGK